MARNVKFEIRRGAGSSLEVLFGKVSLTPTMLHTVANSVVLPAPTSFDLVNGTALATNVAPSPAPVAGQVPWAYKVKITDNHGKTFEYLVGVPDGTAEINFNVLPRYFETKPPLFGQGEQGVPGSAATIAIGTTTSGPTPAVTNSGTSTDAVLDFTLPKGDRGDTGAGVPTGGTALQVVRKNAANTTTEWATLTKSLVGLGNVDNTSDANKPVSTAQQTALTALEGRTDTNVSNLVANPTSLTTIGLDSKYVRKDVLWFDVRDYGAVIDGVTNDAPAIQAAINAAAGKGRVYMPQGIYGQANRILFQPNTFIWGYNATLLRLPGIGGMVVNWIQGDSTTAGYEGFGNITVIGLTLDANTPTNNGDLNGLTFGHCRNILLRDMSFLRMKGHHALELNAVDTALVENCSFYGYTNTILDVAKEAIQLDVANPGDYGAPDGTMTRNVTIRGCTFGPLGLLASYPVSVGAHARFADSKYRNISVEGCTSIDNTVRFVEAYHWEFSRVSDNYASCPSLLGGTHNLRSVGSVGLKVAGNRFYGGGQSISFTTSSDYCTATDNFIQGGTAGIYVGAGTTNSLLQGNYIDKTKDNSIVVDSSSRGTSIIGNTLQGAGYPSGVNGAIRLTGTTQDVLIAGGNKVRPHGVDTEASFAVSIAAGATKVHITDLDARGMPAGISGTHTTGAIVV